MLATSPHKIFLVIYLSFFIICTGLAQSTQTEPRQTWQLAPFTSLGILGSQDLRSGLYISYQTQRPEPRFTFHGHKLDLALEYGFAYSFGGGWESQPHDQTAAINIMGLAKYEVVSKFGAGYYVELGWGLHYASEATFDLDLRLNSTPVTGLGFITGNSRGLRAFGLRYYHISNAGFKTPNQGQNQLMFLTSFAL